ncbi:MAG: RnfABCDGE type electron transport complex subunit D [Caldilineaceae bacterium]
MMKWVDNLLNRVTMYRLILYYLIALLGVALLFAFAGLSDQDPYALLFSTGFLVGVCALTNWIFAQTFAAPPNVESTYISALILALIISPLESYQDLWFLGWAAILAMASKYIVAIKHKHLFNPVAFAVALTYFTINQSASWWVGNIQLLPFVLLGGILIVRKTQRFALVYSFFVSALVTLLAFGLLERDGAPAMVESFQRTVYYSPLFFFAFVILTEPLTMPPTRRTQIIYGALVGVVGAPQFHLGSFYPTPEVAILVGNLFAYIVSPKAKLILRLKERIQLSADVYDFIFAPTPRLAFAPGQYMEWTLGHADPDQRGNRRYFTLASAPTEDELRIGVKFYERSSSFKQALLTMEPEHEIVAAQLAGDFVLPANLQQHCVLIAGGIGITPYRSMIKYLLDTGQRRPITLIYACRTVDDFVYHGLFTQARRAWGLQTIYTVTDRSKVPAWWTGHVGYITPQLIKTAVPDYKECLFYISGPNRMVNAFRTVLRQLQVKNSQIKTDFFSGLA